MTRGNQNSIDEDEREYYESVGIHQKQKHKFIETYLKIWSENVGNNSPKPPSVDFIDLYAASGMAYDSNLDEEWEGSALLLTRALGEYRNPGKIYLNSYSDDSEELKRNKDILKRKIKSITESDYPHLRDNQVLGFSKDVLEATDIILKKFNRDFPSLWILDPYHPDHLPWEVIEKIGTTEGKPLHKKKPEMIITLMTSILQRNIERKPELFSKAIGLQEEEWRPLYNQYKEEYLAKGKNECTRDVIVDIFAFRLSTMYYKQPVVTPINARKGGIVYTMLLVTNSDAGYYMMKKKMPEFEIYKAGEWRNEAQAVNFIKDNPTQKKLFDF